MRTVIKIGGSIIKHKAVLRRVLHSISATCAAARHQIVVVPGGGGLVDCIRKLQNSLSLPDTTAHWMAIKAMDINGMTLPALHENYVLADTAHCCKEQWRKSRIPVFLVYNELSKDHTLPRSWAVTSDSIAVHIAHKLQADNTVLLKSVDGIYTNDKTHDIANRICARELKYVTPNQCVDAYLSKLVVRYKKQVLVMSGMRETSLRNFLQGNTFIGTTITPS